MWLLKTSTVFRGCLKVLICWTYSINFESIKYLLSIEFYRQWLLQAVLFLHFLNFKIARIVWVSVYKQLSTNLKYKLSSQWGESVGLPCMKEIYRISKFTKLESSTFAKGFFVCMRPIFCYSGIIFTLLNFFRFQTNLKIYSGKPDISVKFNSDKNIISKRDNLKIKESYVWQISNVNDFKGSKTTNGYLKNEYIYNKRASEQTYFETF